MVLVKLFVISLAGTMALANPGRRHYYTTTEPGYPVIGHYPTTEGPAYPVRGHYPTTEGPAYPVGGHYPTTEDPAYPVRGHYPTTTDLAYPGKKKHPTTTDATYPGKTKHPTTTDKSFCNRICTFNYNPVCGSYGNTKKTFSNGCHMSVASCQERKQYIKIHDGDCYGRYDVTPAAF